MRILMLSTDKTLLGEQVSGGDAVERHLKYGEFCDVLDVVVFNVRGCHSERSEESRNKIELSDKVTIYPTDSKSRFYYVTDAFRIAQQIYQNSPFDLVVCQDPFLTGYVGLKLKNKFNIKLLVHFHGDFWQNKNYLKEKWYNFILLWLSKKVVKNADGIRAMSKGIKNKLVASGVSESKIRVIATPVAIEKFLTFEARRAEELRQKYGICHSHGSGNPEDMDNNYLTGFPIKSGMTKEKKKKIILFVGRLEKEKNIPLLLTAFRQVKEKYKDAILLIVGDGGQMSHIKYQMSKLKLEGSVKLIGRVPHNDLTNYYHLADVVVLSSLSESFGKVLVEAGAAGVPAVATATTGAKEIIQDGTTGFLVPINNAKEMQEKILLLLRDENLKQKMGQNAQKYVKENFASVKQTEKITKFWQEVIDRT